MDAALAIAGSADAMAAVNDLLTLEQGAVIAGYEADGDTEAVSDLLDAATEGRFEHKHAELVETADERKALREGLEHWREKGFTSATYAPNTAAPGSSSTAWSTPRPGEKVTDEQLDDLTAEHVLAFVETEYEEVYLNAAGERVDETTIDWSVQDEGPDAVAADGMVDCRLLTEKLEWSPCVTWFHNDPARDGLETHTEHRQRSRSAMTDVHLPGDAPSAAAGVAQDGGESAKDRRRPARPRAGRASAGTGRGRQA